MGFVSAFQRWKSWNHPSRKEREQTAAFYAETNASLPDGYKIPNPFEGVKRPKDVLR